MHSKEIWFYDSDVKLQALRGQQEYPQSCGVSLKTNFMNFFRKYAFQHRFWSEVEMRVAPQTLSCSNRYVNTFTAFSLYIILV